MRKAIRRIVAYGSMMNEEIRNELAPSAENVTPVWIGGYKRTFLIWESSRHYKKLGINKSSAVPIIEGFSNNKMNGICFNLPIEDYSEVVGRRSLFIPTLVDCTHFTRRYEIQNCVMFMPDKTKLMRLMRRKPQYINQCREGAYSLGENFGKAFDRTTYLRSGSTLERHIEQTRK